VKWRVMARGITMKLLLASIFCATAVCLAAPGAGSATEAPRRPILLQQCEGLAPQQAIAACDTLLTLNRFDEPRQRSMVLVWRGKAYQAIGAYPQALSNFEQAITSDQTNAEAYVARALWREDSGAFRFANLTLQYDDLETAIRHDPDHVIALLEYAFVLDYEWASEPGDDYLPRARRLAPEHPWLYFTLARLEAMDDESEYDASLSRALIDEAVSRAPENHLIRLDRGSGRRYKGDAEGALIDYDAVLALRPWNFAAHQGRAEALTDLRRYEEAIDAYSNALLWRDDPASLSGRCFLRLRPGEDVALALWDCERAAQRDPENVQTLGTLALALLLSGDPEKAQIIASRAIALNQSSARAWYIRSLIYRMLGKDNWAADDIRAAVRLEQDIQAQMADIESWVLSAPAR